MASVSSIPFVTDPNYWAGVATALLAVGVPVLLKRFAGSPPTPSPDCSLPESAPSTDVADNWEAPATLEDERRRQPRRQHRGGFAEKS